MFFSALIASAMGLLRSGIHAQLHWGQVIEPYQQMERSLNRLARDLESSQRFFGVPFVGRQDRLEFARVDLVQSADGQMSPEWLHVIYRWETHGDQLVLIREEGVWRTEKKADGPAHQEVLMHVLDGHFTFGAQDPQQQLSWTGEWKGKPGELPRLVKVDCTMPSLGVRPPARISRAIRNPVGILPSLGTP